MESNIRMLVELNRRFALENRLPYVRRAMRLLRRGLLRESLAKAFVLRVQSEVDKLHDEPNMLPRPPEYDDLYPDGPPPFVIGEVVEQPGVPFGVFPRGPFFYLIEGSSGGGKTNGLRALISAIESSRSQQERPLSIIILDFKGKSFRDLPALFGSHWKYFDAHKGLRLGLQPPIGVSPRQWINNIVSTFRVRAELAYGAVTLANVIGQLVRVMNPEPGQQLLFPDFQLLHDVVRALPKTAFADKPQYRDSVLQVLRGVIDATGEFFGAFNGLDLERDIISQGDCAVISVPNIAPSWINLFLQDLFMLQPLVGRVARDQTGDDPDVLFVLDDADDLVSHRNEATFHLSMSPLARSFRMLRESKVGIALVVGGLRGVSSQILNQMSGHCIFRNDNGDSDEIIRRMLCLPPGNESMVHSLDQGVCLARVPGPWSQTFLAKTHFIPKLQIEQPPRDVNPHVPAKPLSELPDVMRFVRAIRSRMSPNEDAGETIEYTDLRDETRRLVFLASLHPYWPTARLFEMIGSISAPIRAKVLAELGRSRLADLAKLRAGSRNHVLMELTDKAWEILGKPKHPTRGRGGLVHRAIAAWVGETGRNHGHQVEYEFVIPGATGHPADVAWLSDGKCEVFEVVVSSEGNVTAHVRAALDESDISIERITIVAPQKQTLTRIRRHVESERGGADERIAWTPVEVFEKEIWPK